MEIRGEVEGSEFGDSRLGKRHLKLAELLAKDPAQSFPKAAGTDAELEGTYRFLNNRSVTPDRILEPHYGATLQRCAALRSALIAHDTTNLGFGTSRDGLGRGRRAGNDSFLGHFALAVTPTREALGVIGLQTFFRSTRGTSAKAKESRRWHALVDDVVDRIDGKFEAIHVMDREADAYELLALLVARKQRFVIRQQFDRAVTFEGKALRTRAAMEGAPVLLEREVRLSRRPPGEKGRTPPKRMKKHPPRPERVAQLEVTARRFDVQRPVHLGTLPPHLTLNVVLVHEPNPPAGLEPVDWCLITTEAIETAEDVAAIVDAYRARWVIEEYFKALKTGCAFEKRQLETRVAILNALALFAPIAWQLLVLRQLSRNGADTPADTVLSPLKLRVLQGHKRTKLREGATVREAMLAVAALGGHIKNNGDPGWIVLGRGYEDLLLLEQGAAIALGWKT
jgi:hypothetical protein